MCIAGLQNASQLVVSGDLGLFLPSGAISLPPADYRRTSQAEALGHQRQLQEQ